MLPCGARFHLALQFQFSLSPILFKGTINGTQTIFFSEFQFSLSPIQNKVTMQQLDDELERND